MYIVATIFPTLFVLLLLGGVILIKNSLWMFTSKRRLAKMVCQRNELLWDIEEAALARLPYSAFANEIVGILDERKKLL
jgi:hypothetical protein